IKLMNPDGTDVRTLAMPGTWIETGPSWSPSGDRFAFTGANGVWVANADGSDPQQISAQGWGPAWSSDGKTIAFTTRDGVHTISPDGSNERTLVSEPGLAYKSVAFAPDGSSLLFTAEPDVQHGLQEYDLF